MNNHRNMANSSQSSKVVGMIVLLALLFLGFRFRQHWAPRPEIGPSTRNIHGISGQVSILRKDREYKGARTLPEPPSLCRPFNAGPTGRQCDRWIVVTSIHPVTDCLRKIASLKGWCMVVVADKKGPATMEVPNVDYLTVLQQENCGYHICQTTPWNHFGRKNIGYLYAMEHGAKWIYDTDDDNEPLTDKVPVVDEKLSPLGQLVASTDVWNPYPTYGSVHPCSDKEIWPRGFPLSRIRDELTKRTGMAGEVDSARLGVVQFLAQHDPDVDAIFRLTRQLPYDFNTAPKAIVLPTNTLSPYNAQATLHFQDAFWGLLLPISVHGRVSDIWRSYITQRLLWDIGKRLAFHSPFVVQNRNVHNYLADFDSEMDLYYKTETLVEFLERWQPADPASTLEQRLFQMQIGLYEYGFIEEQDVKLTVDWIQDLRCRNYAFPKVLPKP